MDLSEFDYALPKALIAQEPLAVRGASRLMVLEGDRISHRMFSDLPDHLHEDDVLVLNDSRVVPARLFGKRETGGKVELLLLGSDGDRAEALVRSKPLKAGEVIHLPDGTCRVEARIAGSRYSLSFSVPGGIPAYLDRFGEMPTPPYIKKALRQQDRYQTVFAQRPGSVAAPTAGLHFTPGLLERLRAQGVATAFITLHIGPATFQPIRETAVERHRMEPEYFRIGEEAARTINGRKGRLVTVGTTTVKALESAIAMGSRQQAAGIMGDGAKPLSPEPRDPDPEPRTPKPGVLVPTEGWSELFIYPGYQFRSRPDAVLTNFHLPRSTLIMLVCALVGRERLLGAYAEAVRAGYRFYSFGDAMLCST